MTDGKAATEQAEKKRFLFWIQLFTGEIQKRKLHL